MFNKTTPEKPTTEVFADTVLSRESCKKHKAVKGEPCWTLHSSSGRYLAAFCNVRARRAGFNHKISEKSLRRNNFQKR